MRNLNKYIKVNAVIKFNDDFYDYLFKDYLRDGHSSVFWPIEISGYGVINYTTKSLFKFHNISPLQAIKIAKLLDT